MTADRPVLHLTNWSSRILHRGTAYTIMRRPRRWELGAGCVEALTPSAEDLDALRSGAIGVDEYRCRFEAGLAGRDLRLGVLRAEPTGHLVLSGDTLCCACSRDAALRGECHRVWAARALVRAGWTVYLDGVLLLLAQDNQTAGGDRG